MSEYLKDLEKYRQEKTIETTNKPDNNDSRKFKPKPDPVLLKLHPQPHPLSVEEQIFFIKLTEGAFGFNEQIRNEILQTVSSDYHVKFIAPYLCDFIKEAIHVNIAFPDLSLLIYAVRVIKSLISNPHVDLKQHLHFLIPAALSCVISKKISKYNYDNHWTVRDFAAQVVASICFQYNNKTNDIKKRVIQVYMRAIQEPKRPLPALYGGLKGISLFGEEVVKICIIPSLMPLGRRICMILEKSMYQGEPNIEVKQIKRITDLVLTITGPLLLKYRNVNDGGISYVNEFGYLGYSLYTHVKNLEKIEIDKKNQFVYLLRAQQQRF